MTLLVGFGILERLGLLVWDARVTCTEGKTGVSAFTLFTHELGLRLGQANTLRKDRGETSRLRLERMPPGPACALFHRS